MAPNKIPNEEVLLDNLGKIAYTLDKTYISELSSGKYSVLYFKNYNGTDGETNENKENTNEKDAVNPLIDYASNIRCLKVVKCVLDKDEKVGECFKNVLSLFADGDTTVALIIKRCIQGTELYFVIKNEDAARNEETQNNIELLDKSLRGNFPGTKTEIINGEEKIEKTKEIFSFDKAKSVSVLVNSPSEYSEDYITQGIDKLLNGIVPKTEDEEYAVMFLAESLSPHDVRKIVSGYEEMATDFYPYLSYQFQMGKNKSDSIAETESSSKSESVSESVFKTHSVNAGLSAGLNAGVNLGIKIIGINTGAHGGANVGASVGYGYSWGKSKTNTNALSKGESLTKSISTGESENTSYTYKSYLVANLIERLEKTIERLTKSSSTGLWKFSTYVIGNEEYTSKNVANYIRAITQGKESYTEPSFIQEWSFTSDETSPFKEIMKYLKHFTHPIFATSIDKEEEKTEKTVLVTATSYVSTDELSNVMAFPRKSIQGLPVLECVQFGREPHSLSDDTTFDLDIGCAYHMHNKIKNQRICISKEELKKHTFITGSTGSGKSNTIYKLLEQLNSKDTKFMVIEPAKGEYGYVFGSKPGVTVYGTNPNLDTKMLRINPFAFSKKTHILEHLDRLVEIFNVCWPMYAAMPAILKDAIERAYISSGWDLETSVNRYSDKLYPTFNDVLRHIKIVLKESEYSADNKSDYTGALATRLRSLTNGINGLIFSADAISDEELFDSNVIVDLSRVGSSETKSLIMGILILKLQEHRMDTRKANTPLHHVTVLEEAHNLLKRTSYDQSSESSNLLGKSVEMLANSIAEMRTYGEGFIIADQSPGLLDMSVIRNTNTKIIMRLPDFSDRELVGKAAGLNDNQIIEIGKLEKGVASISQSDWVEPILCNIDEFDIKRFVNNNDGWKGENIVEKNTNEPETISTEKELLDLIMSKELYNKTDNVDSEKMKRLKSSVIYSKLDSTVKCDFLDLLATEDANDILPKARKLIYDFLNAEKAIQEAGSTENLEKWCKTVVYSLSPSVIDYDKRLVNLVLALVIKEKAERDVSYRDLYNKFNQAYIEQGGVIR